MKATLLSILLSAVTLIRAAAGNDGLNLLQAEYSKPGVAESFAAGKAWFPFPAYEDRAGWAALFGPDAGKVIRRGEQLLDYQWQYIPASAYLAFERTGDRQAMERPEGANRGAMIALTLALRPALVVADEPTTALDACHQRQVLRCLADVARDASLIFVSHDLSAVQQLADEVLVMQAGSCVEYGQAAQLFDAPVHVCTRHLVRTRLALWRGFRRALGDK